MRIKLYIIIPIILFTLVYITYMDNNSNTDIKASTDLYQIETKADVVNLPSKKNELVTGRKNLASVATEKTKKNRQHSLLINKAKKKVNENSKNNINEIEDIPQDLIVNMTKLFKTAKSKNWEEFNHAVEFLDVIDQQSLNLALFQATLNGAPLNMIKDLLNVNTTLKPPLFAEFNNNQIFPS